MEWTAKKTSKNTRNVYDMYVMSNRTFTNEKARVICVAPDQEHTKGTYTPRVHLFLTNPRLAR